jgi:hypothetical protein
MFFAKRGRWGNFSVADVHCLDLQVFDLYGIMSGLLLAILECYSHCA